MPVTYPPQPMNGLMISGYLTPSSARDITYPPDLLAEIEAQVGKYKLYPDVVHAPGKEGEYLDNLHEIVDQRIAPTVLYLLGVPVPRELDGKVLTDAVEDTHMRSHPVDYTDISTDKRNLDEEYSSEEDEAIRERLKALGYLQ